MSANMLSDANTINDFNPFVMGAFSLPGASRKPHAFVAHPVPEKEVAFPVDEESPMCDYGITAGWRTIDMCRPQEPNCPMSRPLVPGRNIDHGFTEKCRKEKRVEAPRVMMEVGLIITILLLLLFVR